MKLYLQSFSSPSFACDSFYSKLQDNVQLKHGEDFIGLENGDINIQFQQAIQHARNDEAQEYHPLTEFIQLKIFNELSLSAIKNFQ